MTLPDCTCGPKRTSRPPGSSHALSCALALAALGKAPRKSPVGSSTIAPLGASTAAEVLDALGRRPRGRLGQRGRTTYSRGIGFPTRLEALVFEELWRLEEARGLGGGILRRPRYDLWSTWREGMGRPLCFTPDFQVARIRFEGSGLALVDVEVHEAKGPRSLESRDYVTRLAAFRSQFPWIPFTVWRRDKEAGPSALKREDLAAIASAPKS